MGPGQQTVGYNEREAVRAEIRKLTIWGIFKYGMQLSIVEISTLGSIYVFKLIIDFLGEPESYSQNYAYGLFGAFAALRMLTILARSYYDLHVYNYFKFV